MVDEIYKILFLQSNPKETLEKLRIFRGKTDHSTKEHIELLRAFTLMFLDDLKGSRLLSKNLRVPEVKVLHAILDIKKLKFREGHEKLKEYTETGENIYVKGEAMYRLTQLYILLNDLKSAEKMYEKLLEHSLIHDMPAFRWMNEIHRARITLSTSGNLDLTIAILEAAEKGLMESRNINRRIVSQVLLAYNESLRKNIERTREYLKRAYRLSQLSGSSLVQGLVSYYECIINRMYGRMDMEVCNRAKSLIELSSDEIMKTEIRIDEIKHLIEEKRSREAEESIHNLMERLKNTDYRFKIPLLTYYLSETKLLEGKLDEVIRIVDEYIAQYGTERPFLYLTMLHLKASALSRKGRMEEALSIFRDTLRITQENNLEKYWSHEVEDLLEKLGPTIEEFLKREKSIPPYLINLLLEGNYLSTYKDTINLDMDRAMDYLDFSTAKKYLELLEEIEPNFRERFSRRIRYRINLLGYFRITIGNETLTEGDFQRPIYAKVLKYLIINRNRMIEREKIMEDIWGENRSEGTGRTLNTILSNIRKLLHPLGEKSSTIKSGKRSIGFFPDDRFTIDIQEFEESAKKGNILYFSGRISEAKALLRQAIEIYVGDLLPSDLYEEWIERERERLKNLFIKALLTLTDIMKREGFVELAISMLEEALYRYPEREIYDALTSLLRRSGQEERVGYWSGYIERVLFK